MMKLSSSFARERELIIVDAKISGPAAATKARLVLDTGAAATTLVPELIERIGYNQRDSFQRATVHTAVGDALASYGIAHLDLPSTPERVWRALRDAGVVT